MAYSALETYLNDHFAGATAGVNLAKMAAEEHKSDEHGPFFGEISSEISADYEKLQELMTSLGVEQSATKGALAEIGSKMMAPKFTAGEDDELNAFVTLRDAVDRRRGQGLHVEGAEDRRGRQPGARSR